jgi:hypothetical protein
MTKILFFPLDKGVSFRLFQGLTATIGNDNGAKCPNFTYFRLTIIHY